MRLICRHCKEYYNEKTAVAGLRLKNGCRPWRCPGCGLALFDAATLTVPQCTV
jgi:hypothetical protein